MGVLWHEVWGWAMRLSRDRGRLGVALLTLALGLGVNADLLHFERKDRAERTMAGPGHYAAVSEKLSGIAGRPLSDGDIATFVRGMMRQQEHMVSGCARSHGALQAARAGRALRQARCLRTLRATRAKRAGRGTPVALAETSWAPDVITAPPASPAAAATALAPVPAPGFGDSGCPAPSGRGGR
jgi:hypothetical protein